MIRPQHQNEFNSLFYNALDTYKKQHNVLATNKKNHDQIFELLHAKLALDYLTNLDFNSLNAWKITRYIFYLLGFAKIIQKLEFETTRKAISELITETLTPLPARPELIPTHLSQVIPFDLPITNRQTLTPVVRTLRLMFFFDKLPDAYIADNHEALPTSYKNLRDKV